MKNFRPLKLCLVDMNNGVANQATRCFRRILDAFSQRVRAANPGVDITLRHVQPRNLGEVPDLDTDMALSSGGPGSPFDGYEDAWCTNWRTWVDHVVDRNRVNPTDAPSALMICHSYELSVIHFGVATMQPREKRKFGVMPHYPTEEGQKSALLGAFGDRLFAYEHRNWEAVDYNQKRALELGSVILARESRDGLSKGRCLTSMKFAEGVEGTIFHPEADRPGVMAWVNKPETEEAFKDAYGETTYDQMMDTLNDPTRLARTFSLLIPGWLNHRFNRMSEAWGYRPLPPLVQDLSEFEDATQLSAAG